MQPNSPFHDQFVETLLQLDPDDQEGRKILETVRQASAKEFSVPGHARRLRLRRTITNRQPKDSRLGETVAATARVPALRLGRLSDSLDSDRMFADPASHSARFSHAESKRDTMARRESFDQVLGFHTPGLIANGPTGGALVSMTVEASLSQKGPSTSIGALPRLLNPQIPSHENDHPRLSARLIEAAARTPRGGVKGSASEAIENMPATTWLAALTEANNDPHPHRSARKMAALRRQKPEAPAVNKEARKLYVDGRLVFKGDDGLLASEEGDVYTVAFRPAGTIAPRAKDQDRLNSANERADEPTGPVDSELKLWQDYEQGKLSEDALRHALDAVRQKRPPSACHQPEKNDEQKASKDEVSKSAMANRILPRFITPDHVSYEKKKPGQRRAEEGADSTRVEPLSSPTLDRIKQIAEKETITSSEVIDSVGGSISSRPSSASVNSSGMAAGTGDAQPMGRVYYAGVNDALNRAKRQTYRQWVTRDSVQRGRVLLEAMLHKADIATHKELSSQAEPEIDSKFVFSVEEEMELLGAKDNTKPAVLSEGTRGAYTFSTAPDPTRANVWEVCPPKQDLLGLEPVPGLKRPGTARGTSNHSITRSEALQHQFRPASAVARHLSVAEKIAQIPVPQSQNRLVTSVAIATDTLMRAAAKPRDPATIRRLLSIQPHSVVLAATPQNEHGANGACQHEQARNAVEDAPSLDVDDKSGAISHGLASNLQRHQKAQKDQQNLVERRKAAIAATCRVPALEVPVGLSGRPEPKQSSRAGISPNVNAPHIDIHAESPSPSEPDASELTIEDQPNDNAPATSDVPKHHPKLQSVYGLQGLIDALPVESSPGESKTESEVTKDISQLEREAWFFGLARFALDERSRRELIASVLKHVAESQKSYDRMILAQQHAAKVRILVAKVRERREALESQQTEKLRETWSIIEERMLRAVTKNYTQVREERCAAVWRQIILAVKVSLHAKSVIEQHRLQCREQNAARRILFWFRDRRRWQKIRAHALFRAKLSRIIGEKSRLAAERVEEDRVMRKATATVVQFLDFARRRRRAIVVFQFIVTRRAACVIQRAVRAFLVRQRWKQLIVAAQLLRCVDTPISQPSASLMDKNASGTFIPRLTGGGITFSLDELPLLVRLGSQPTRSVIRCEESEARSSYESGIAESVEGALPTTPTDPIGQLVSASAAPGAPAQLEVQMIWPSLVANLSALSSASRDRGAGSPNPTCVGNTHPTGLSGSSVSQLGHSTSESKPQPLSDFLAPVCYPLSSEALPAIVPTSFKRFEQDNLLCFSAGPGALPLQQSQHQDAQGAQVGQDFGSGRKLGASVLGKLPEWSSMRAMTSGKASSGASSAETGNASSSEGDSSLGSQNECRLVGFIPKVASGSRMQSLAKPDIDLNVGSLTHPVRLPSLSLIRETLIQHLFSLHPVFPLSPQKLPTPLVGGRDAQAELGSSFEGLMFRSNVAPAVLAESVHALVASLWGLSSYVAAVNALRTLFSPLELKIKAPMNYIEATTSAKSEPRVTVMLSSAAALSGSNSSNHHGSIQLTSIDESATLARHPHPAVTLFRSLESHASNMLNRMNVDRPRMRKTPRTDGFPKPSPRSTTPRLRSNRFEIGASVDLNRILGHLLPHLFHDVDQTEIFNLNQDWKYQSVQRMALPSSATPLSEGPKEALSSLFGESQTGAGNEDSWVQELVQFAYRNVERKSELFRLLCSGRNVNGDPSGLGNQIPYYRGVCPSPVFLAMANTWNLKRPRKLMLFLRNYLQHPSFELHLFTLTRVGMTLPTSEPSRFQDLKDRRRNKTMLQKLKRQAELTSLLLSGFFKAKEDVPKELESTSGGGSQILYLISRMEQCSLRFDQQRREVHCLAHFPLGFDLTDFRADEEESTDDQPASSWFSYSTNPTGLTKSSGSNTTVSGKMIPRIDNNSRRLGGGTPNHLSSTRASSRGLTKSLTDSMKRQPLKLGLGNSLSSSSNQSRNVADPEHAEMPSSNTPRNDLFMSLRSDSPLLNASKVLNGPSWLIWYNFRTSLLSRRIMSKSTALGPLELANFMHSRSKGYIHAETAIRLAARVANCLSWTIVDTRKLLEPGSNLASNEVEFERSSSRTIPVRELGSPVDLSQQSGPLIRALVTARSLELRRKRLFEGEPDKLQADGQIDASAVKQVPTVSLKGEKSTLRRKNSSRPNAGKLESRVTDSQDGGEKSYVQAVLRCHSAGVSLGFPLTPFAGALPAKRKRREGKESVQGPSSGFMAAVAEAPLAAGESSTQSSVTFDDDHSTMRSLTPTLSDSDLLSEASGFSDYEFSDYLDDSDFDSGDFDDDSDGSSRYSTLWENSNTFSSTTSNDSIFMTMSPQAGAGIRGGYDPSSSVTPSPANSLLEPTDRSNPLPDDTASTPSQSSSHNRIRIDYQHRELHHRVRLRWTEELDTYLDVLQCPLDARMDFATLVLEGLIARYQGQSGTAGGVSSALSVLLPSKTMFRNQQPIRVGSVGPSPQRQQPPVQSRVTVSDESPGIKMTQGESTGTSRHRSHDLDPSSPRSIVEGALIALAVRRRTRARKLAWLRVLCEEAKAVVRARNWQLVRQGTGERDSQGFTKSREDTNNVPLAYYADPERFPKTSVRYAIARLREAVIAGHERVWKQRYEERTSLLTVSTKELEHRQQFREKPVYMLIHRPHQLFLVRNGGGLSTTTIATGTSELNSAGQNHKRNFSLSRLAIVSEGTASATLSEEEIKRQMLLAAGSHTAEVESAMFFPAALPVSLESTKHVQAKFKPIGMRTAVALSLLTSMSNSSAEAADQTDPVIPPVFTASLAAATESTSQTLYRFILNSSVRIPIPHFPKPQLHSSRILDFTASTRSSSTMSMLSSRAFELLKRMEKTESNDPTQSKNNTRLLLDSEELTYSHQVIRDRFLNYLELYEDTAWKEFQLKSAAEGDQPTSRNQNVDDQQKSHLFRRVGFFMPSNKSAHLFSLGQSHRKPKPVPTIFHLNSDNASGLPAVEGSLALAFEDWLSLGEILHSQFGEFTAYARNMMAADLENIGLDASSGARSAQHIRPQHQRSRIHPTTQEFLRLVTAFGQV